eukprot:6185327-Pleurochrysis_carterae.AAC.1
MYSAWNSLTIDDIGDLTDSLCVVHVFPKLTKQNCAESIPQIPRSPDLPYILRVFDLAKHDLLFARVRSSHTSADFLAIISKQQTVLAKAGRVHTDTRFMCIVLPLLSFHDMKSRNPTLNTSRFADTGCSSKNFNLFSPDLHAVLSIFKKT